MATESPQRAAPASFISCEGNNFHVEEIEFFLNAVYSPWFEWSLGRAEEDKMLHGISAKHRFFRYSLWGTRWGLASLPLCTYLEIQFISPCSWPFPGGKASGRAEGERGLSCEQRKTNFSKALNVMLYDRPVSFLLLCYPFLFPLLSYMLGHGRARCGTTSLAGRGCGRRTAPRFAPLPSLFSLRPSFFT